MTSTIVDPGKMNERVSVLELQQENGVFSWIEQISIWAKAELQTEKNLFSQVGIGVKSVKFTIWKRELTLHNAFRWRGNHCFLTDIDDVDFLHYTVTAALIEPQTCSAKRTSEPIRNKLNRPVYADPTVTTFPGCLTEKYLGHTQGEPMVITEVTYVLVAPKVIELTSGELVSIGNATYTVLIPHVLDDYKNEYEITVRRDA